ncbi:YHS domain-containing protein [Paucibacter sp. TC2R-5]|uniref:YHS domain-containing (seleno)protein n=1 Tax=Paucibacter sp. TC2R-5 TaxID=2893555 RepID=UPI0021E41460|nr:YHS domain-containing (seleno)protein [Paucibacter sp. TC2R-5]MCV2360214.1 YHS domain-containing protein [Paucibacter sp. TC2R-5]
MKAVFARRTLLAAMISTLAALAVMPNLAHAYDETSTSALNVDAHNVAVKGHDVVAYFTAGSPTAGKAEFTAKHEGAVYHFSSAANRDTFKANPTKYAPQFGGFCAMGVALDKKLDGDPSAWKIVDDKLYLNVNKDVQKKWVEDIPGNLAKAGSAWPLIKSKAPKDL